MPIKTCENLGPEKQAAAGPGNPQPPQQLECAHWRLEKNWKSAQQCNLQRAKTVQQVRAKFLFDRRRALASDGAWAWTAWPMPAEMLRCAGASMHTRTKQSHVCCTLRKPLPPQSKMRNKSNQVCIVLRQLLMAYECRCLLIVSAKFLQFVPVSLCSSRVWVKWKPLGMDNTTMCWGQSNSKHMLNIRNPAIWAAASYLNPIRT